MNQAPKRSAYAASCDGNGSRATVAKRLRLQRPRKTHSLLARQMHKGHAITLPNELWLEVMSYLTKSELVHRVSKVSKHWCYRLSRHPSFWQVLDGTIWKKKRPSRNPEFAPNSVFSSCKKFLQFLSRPQFSQLKRFTPPDTYRTKGPEIFNHLAQRFPRLEHLDVRGYERNRSVIPFPCDFESIGTKFPFLTSLCINLRWGGFDDLERCLSTVGKQLEKLTVLIDISDKCFTDTNFLGIAQHCPNLQEFRYEAAPDLFPTAFFSAKGPLTLLQACQKITHVSIVFPSKAAANEFKAFFHGFELKQRHIWATVEYEEVLFREDGFFEEDTDDDGDE